MNTENEYLVLCELYGWKFSFWGYECYTKTKELRTLWIGKNVLTTDTINVISNCM